MGPHDDDEVEAEWEGVLFEAERFAEEPFEAVSGDGVTDASADREAEPSAAQFVALAEERQWPGGLADLGVVDRLELGRVRQALVAPEGELGESGVAGD